MKKTLAALATASFVVALALSLVAPAHAQLFNNNDNTTNNSSTTTTATTTDTTQDTTGTTGTSDDMTDTSTTTPGLPNTGVGGDAAMNFAIILTSGIIAAGGTILVARKLAA